MELFFLCCLVLYYVSQVIVWEDYTHVISWDQIEELFIVIGSLYVFPTRNIVNFLINFIF